MHEGKKGFQKQIEINVCPVLPVETSLFKQE